MPNAYGATAGNLSDPFWGSLTDDGIFRVPRCDACGTYRFPPTSMCPSCHAIAFTWTPVSGDATLWTWTIVHRPPKPQFVDLVPYCLGVAQLAEGPLVLGQVDTTVLAGAEPAVGLQLALVVDPPHGDTPARYHFEVIR
jgi:uncharacterized protein